MLDVYSYVESDGSPLPITPTEKIARICWNINNWQRPSGRNGKSKNKKSFEYRSGYGHEEWLFDLSKIIDGYQYGFLQSIGDNKEKYEGSIFNISFYTIDGTTNDRWWIGKANNVVCISKDESRAIFNKYKAQGWIREMADQLATVDADSSQLLSMDPKHFFNIKFKLQDLELLEEPVKIQKKDPAIKATYYNTLLNKKVSPVLPARGSQAFKFVAGHNEGKVKATITYSERIKDIDLFHNRMKTAVYRELTQLYGSESVGTEQSAGIGSRIDLVLKNAGVHDFYEFKTSPSLRECIREALSQLMEYAYWFDKDDVRHLIIVSQNEITNEAKEYLNKLRTVFRIPVFYQKYNIERKMLEEDKF